MQINKKEIIGKALVNYYTRKNCDKLPDISAEQFFMVAHLVLWSLDKIDKDNEDELIERAGQAFANKIIKAMHEER